MQTNNDNITTPATIATGQRESSISHKNGVLPTDNNNGLTAVIRTLESIGESPAIGIIASGPRYTPVNLDTITDAEAFAIRTLRDWTRATTDRDFRLSMDAWEEMRSMVEVFHEGNYTLENARQDMGNLAALPYFLMVRHATELHQWFTCKMHQTGDGSTEKTARSYADFDAWQLLHSETGQLLKGDTPFDLDVADDPELYALCYGIKAWIEKRRIKFAEQDAQKAQRGGTAE